MKHGRSAKPGPLAPRGLVAVAIAALMAVAAIALIPAAASAAPANGSVDFDIVKRSKAGKGLVKAKIKAKKPAATASDRKGTLLGFVVNKAEAGPPFSTKLKGSIVLKGKKKKSAKLTNLELISLPGETALTGKLGKRQLTLFSSNRTVKTKVDGTTTTYSLPGSKLNLPKQAAKQLNKKLKLKKKAKLKQGPAGKLYIDVAIEGKEEPVDDYPYATECPVVAVEGNPGIGDPPGEIGAGAPLPTFTAGVSQDVIGTSLDWGIKASFRDYVTNIDPKPNDSVQALSPATASAADMSAADSFFGFPATGGTYEAGSEPDHSDDKLVVESSGTALFCKPGHGFNVAFKDPAVVVDGEDSRITADVGVNLNGTWYPFQRVDFAKLDLSAVEPTFTDEGNSVTWEDIPARLTADGSEAIGLGAVYPANMPLDPITVKATLDRPLPQCNIDSDIEGLPTLTPSIDFNTAELPVLEDPVVVEGENLGTINWGFRRSFRATVAIGGASNPDGPFQTLGGASASYPNMGGTNDPAPEGGIGKFFRFPISKYAYEAGTADPDDDRLIATSDAAVGFCNITTGGYAVLLAKPTLIIDGDNSRLVANAYGLKGPFGDAPAMGWAGGRVDLLALDVSGTDAVIDGDTVNWGDAPADETPLLSGIPVDGGFLTNALALASQGPTLTLGGGTGGFDPIGVQINLPPLP